MDVDDPRGDPYAEAISLLAWQLRRAAKDADTTADTDRYVDVANDELVSYSAPWQGPVVDAWLKTLTPMHDLAAVLRLRRVRRLLGDSQPDIVREAYRDDVGRYILVVEYSSGPYGLAEWPKSLQGVSTWTEKTVLAADESGTNVILLALTPTDDGRMRVEPVPARSALSGFGYSGGTPSFERGTRRGRGARRSSGPSPSVSARRGVRPVTGWKGKEHPTEDVQVGRRAADLDIGIRRGRTDRGS